MNGIDFLYLINDIGDDLIENASETALSRKRGLLPHLLTAACICAAVAAIIIYLGLTTQRKEHRKTVGVTEEAQTEPMIRGTETQEETTAITKGPELIVTDNLVIFPEITEPDDYPEETIYNTPDQIPLADTTLSESDFTEATETFESYDSEPVTEEIIPEQPLYRVIGIMWAQDDAENPGSESEELEDRVLFWQDGVYNYYMDAQILGNVTVLYEDGSFESVLEALSNGHIGIYDLSTYGVPYYAE